jgi:hypothetical protein
MDCWPKNPKVNARTGKGVKINLCFKNPLKNQILILLLSLILSETESHRQKYA